MCTDIPLATRNHLDTVPSASIQPFPDRPRRGSKVTSPSSSYFVTRPGESVERLISPVDIVFNQAILVAVVGLVVNALSVLVLGHPDHDHPHHDGQAEAHDHHEHHHHHHHDHNLRSAYLHVLADALTSILAILALLTAKYVGWVWMDPVMGIVGAVLVARWSMGLLGSTASVLLDHQGSQELEKQVREALEEDDGTQVLDLHLWSIGPGIHALIAVVAARESRPAEAYRHRLPAGLAIVHSTIEVHRRDG